MKKAVFIPSVITATLVLVLYLMERIWWCSCGQPFLWNSSPANSHTSQHLFDPYSFSHVQHGMIFFFVLYILQVTPSIRLPIAMLIESLWEVAENTPFVINRYRSVTMALDYFGDSIGNSIGDLLSACIGFYLVSKLSRSNGVMLYLAIELVMLATIRDCLTLNVLMLIYPVQGIKDWQLGV